MLDPSDSNSLESTIYVLVKQAIVLENNYREMLLQGNEVDLRVNLWRKVIEICKSDSEGMSFMSI
jgi:hypothetical protein